jgi:hypothetical protein
MLMEPEPMETPEATLGMVPVPETDPETVLVAEMVVAVAEMAAVAVAAVANKK